MFSLWKWVSLVLPRLAFSHPFAPGCLGHNFQLFYSCESCMTQLSQGADQRERASKCGLQSLPGSVGVLPCEGEARMSLQDSKKCPVISFALWGRWMQRSGVHEEMASDWPNSRFRCCWRWNLVFSYARITARLPWQDRSSQEAGCFFLWLEKRQTSADNTVQTHMSKKRRVHQNLSHSCLSVVCPCVLIHCALNRQFPWVSRH